MLSYYLLNCTEVIWVVVAESKYMPRGNVDHNFYSNGPNDDFNDNQHERMMKDYCSHNQDKMTTSQIRELKSKTFPYLSHDDVRLSMSNRNIVRKELDLDTDSVLSGTDKQSIRDIFFTPCVSACQLKMICVS